MHISQLLFMYDGLLAFTQVLIFSPKFLSFLNVSQAIVYMQMLFAIEASPFPIVLLKRLVLLGYFVLHLAPILACHRSINSNSYCIAYMLFQMQNV